MNTKTSEDNIFLSGSIPLLFAKTATPIIVVMAMNGLFTIVDAYFLGEYVGPDALTAVTLMFPLYMLLVALSTLVSNGFSSVLARALGANKDGEVNKVFAQAIQLSLTVCAIFIVLFLLGGDWLSLLVANGSELLADLGYTYISILIFCSPLPFVLAINIGSLRCEGLLKAMTIVTLMSAFLNIAFDYLFVVEFGWGVAGSAYGTVLAQICSLSAIIVYRIVSHRHRSYFVAKLGVSHWGEFLALGAPMSLGYLGISLSAGLTLYCLQLWAGDGYEATAGAYGIATRLMTFTFLPLLGLSMAFQTIVGNNFGAKSFARSNHALKMAVALAFIYCVMIEITFIITRNYLGSIFVTDEAIISELGRLLPYMVALMFVFGPLMMIGTYFQAIGDAPRAAILGLARTYIFGLPLIFILPFVMGEVGIWSAGIVAEVCVLTLTMFILLRRKNASGQRFGLLEKAS